MSCKSFMLFKASDTNPSTPGGLIPDGASAVGTDAPRSAASKDDADLGLVLRAQSGDASAFGELVDRYERPVYGIVSRMVHTRDDVDDIVQDVFVSAYKSIRGFRRDARFSTWLHTIAVNTTLKRLKVMKRNSHLSIDDPEYGIADTMEAENSPSPLGSLQDREQNEAVRRAIDCLPDKQKIVVVLHYFEDHSCEEIASMLECSVGTVWSRLHYACKKLKSELRWLEQGF